MKKNQPKAELKFPKKQYSITPSMRVQIRHQERGIHSGRIKAGGG